MKLTQLNLQNFKGIEFGDFRFTNNTIIRGDNATGKTTVFDALCWLLFGKDSLDRADFQIKTLKNGEPVHNVNHMVQAAFDNEDGTGFTLKRIYREKYSNPRGGEVKLTGHTTDYFINDVPSKEKEYKSFINNMINEDVFKLITNPLFFNEQYTWQNRRKLLLEMCGDVDDASVINSKDELKRLTELLNGRSVDEQRKIIASKKTAINKELDMIPVRIDEAVNCKPTPLEAEQKLKDDIATIETAIKQLDEDKSVIVNGLDGAERTAKIREVKRKLANRKSQLMNEHTDNERRLEHEYKLSLVQLQMAESERDRYKDREYELDSQIKQEEARIEKLQAEFDTFNKQQFDDELCPTCGQPYPAEKRAELEAMFNIQKATNLEEWQKLIDSAKALKQNYIEQKEIMQVKADGMCSQIEELSNSKNAKQKAMNEVGEVDLDNDVQVNDLKAELFMLELDEDNTSDDQLKRIDSELSELADKRSTLQTELTKYDVIRDITKRINELEQEQQRLINEKNLVDETAFLLDEFVKAKVEMLEDTINKHFTITTFKMANVLVNGSVEDCCETMVDGIPYRSLNNAARINAGIDIINALTKFYNVTAPVFIDNAEAVTKFVNCNSQTIKLIVDETCKELRVDMEV
ncbi:AAA family ATPase [Veillonella nakazawae]|nr:AAA family ATPase [Veillonella nakazawae]MDK7738949.1 AAA family ATPase [Veillonella nakazawae]